jgi:hypothetical protein
MAFDSFKTPLSTTAFPNTDVPAGRPELKSVEKTAFAKQKVVASVEPAANVIIENNRERVRFIVHLHLTAEIQMRSRHGLPQ